MEKNLTISLTIIGLGCFLTLYLAPNTNAQKSDSAQEIRKQITKKKIYPMPRVKSEISLTPSNNPKPKPKSAISRVSEVRVKNKSDLSSAREGNYIPENTMSLTEYDIPPYNSTGKIDPFVPLIKTIFIKKPNLPKLPPPDNLPKTELEKIDLSQLKLTAIVIRDSGGNRGLVQESSGKGHIIVLNTKIGTRGGKVVGIEKDKLIIEERSKDDFGRIIAKKKELTLPSLMAGK
jgi:Tfp pilus assembly protein PilP